MKVFYIGFIDSDRATNPRVDYKFMSVPSLEGNSGGTVDIMLTPIVGLNLGRVFFIQENLSFTSVIARKM